MTKWLLSVLARIRAVSNKEQQQRIKNFYSAMNQQQQPIEHLHFRPFDTRFSHATAMQQMHQLAQQQREEEGEQW